MPISDKQLAANRANAARSTGPRTREGKARSARNAVKHGFTASSFAVVRLEDLHEIAALKHDLVDVYQPTNSQELQALERMALAQQAMLRASRLESGLFTTCLDTALDPCGNPMVPMSPDLAGDGDIEITRAQNRNFGMAQGFRQMAVESNSFTLLLRYQTHAERLYRRSVEDFERLRAMRDENAVPMTLPPEPPPHLLRDDPPRLSPGTRLRTPAPQLPELPNEPISAPNPIQNHPVPAAETKPSIHAGPAARDKIVAYDIGRRQAPSSSPSRPHATGRVLNSFHQNWKGGPPQVGGLFICARDDSRFR